MTKLHLGHLLFLALIGCCQIQNSASAETVWPCPLPEEFAPCVCTSDTTDYLLHADCSLVKSSEDLEKAFTATFSLLTFQSLTIDNSGCQDCDQLTELNQQTFGPISFVEVDIQNTAITAVKESTFIISENTLEKLVLSHNQINDFTFEAIGEFVALTTLNLANNKFDDTTTIPDISSATLESLTLSSNHGMNFAASLVTGCPALKTLNLYACDILAVPMKVLDVEGMFSELNIIHVNFGGNAITALGTANVQGGDEGTLGKVDFSGNQISDVSPRFVSGFGSGGSLDMSNNNITRVFQSDWSDIFAEFNAFDDSVGKIDLSGNPLICGCDMAWLFENSPDSSLLNVITETSLCSDGKMQVTKIPPEIFETCETIGRLNL